ncbi:MAG: hypothetical protein U0667_00420 [Chloroflexota bacterium]
MARRTRWSWPVILVGGTLVALAVAIAWALWPRGFGTGSGGIRTFAWMHGENIMCNAYAVVDPVEGALATGDDPRDPVVLRRSDGTAVSVVWPEVFAASVETPLVLRDESGAEVARGGQIVTLGQTRVGSAAGTFDHPYVAAGLVFRGCYPRAG